MVKKKVVRRRDWRNSQYKDLFRLMDASDKLNDGEALYARAGVDFTCQPRSFAGQLYLFAKDQERKVAVAVFRRGVAFRFFSPRGFWKPYLPAFPVVMKQRREDERRGGRRD